MMFNRNFKRQFKLGLLVYLLTSSSLFAAAIELPEENTEGLQRISDTGLAVVYVKPGVDMNRYSRIYLEDTSVSFKENWQRNRNRSTSNRVSNSDLVRIKSDLAGLFHDVFTRILEDGAYTLASAYGNNVLLIKPAIINLDIVAADFNAAGRSRTIAESAGEMTLYLELYDSMTGELLAKVLDLQL